MRPDWNSYHMLQAKLAAVRSTCNSRPQGAVLVIENRVVATGYNGALPGQEHCSDHPELTCPTCQGRGTAWAVNISTPVVSEREVICWNCEGRTTIPYCRRRATQTPDSQKDRACASAHAEANAVAQAARMGIAIAGATLYCTTRPCAVCEKLLVQAGIVRVYYELDYDDPGHCLSALPMERLEISPEVVGLAKAMLEPETSRRRLGRTG